MKEEIDYYILPNGLLVFTAKYLAERGYCCGNGCQHCPYDYVNMPEPQRSELIQNKLNNEKGNEE